MDFTLCAAFRVVRQHTRYKIDSPVLPASLRCPGKRRNEQNDNSMPSHQLYFNSLNSASQVSFFTRDQVSKQVKKKDRKKRSFFSNINGFGNSTHMAKSQFSKEFFEILQLFQQELFCFNNNYFVRVDLALRVVIYYISNIGTCFRIE